MINSINVNKSEIGKHSQFHYIPDINNFPDEIKFSSGINIIIGKNGTGKSTILNMIRNYFFIDEYEYHSPIDYRKVCSSIFLNSNGGLHNSVSIKADYSRTVFSYPDRIPKDQHECKNAEDIANVFFSARSSAGENRLYRLDKLFTTMFGDKEILKFPLQQILDTDDELDAYKDYQKYLIDNHTESNEYTILFDEPDMNLDIDNVDQIVTILSTQKEMTQVIAVVHNPFVINILSKYEYINFIELTPGYLKNIKDKISKYTRNLRQYEKF